MWTTREMYLPRKKVSTGVIKDESEVHHLLIVKKSLDTGLGGQI